jgi:phage tail sheath gpL-like
MSLVRLVIDSEGSTDSFKSVCNLAPGSLDAANNFVNYLAGLIGGSLQGSSLAFQVGAVQATGSIVQSSTGAANNQTLTICGVTFTAKTSGASGNEWNRNNTVATSAANLAAAINASEDLTGIVTATADSGTVTLTAVVPGLIGNGLVAANVDCANTTVNSFADGEDGTAYTIDLT